MSNGKFLHSFSVCYPYAGSSKPYNKSMSFKFGQVNVSSKDFYKRKQFRDLFSLDYDKVIADPIQCNNGKDKRYFIGYETSNGIIPLYIKTPKNVFSNGVRQYSENSVNTMSFDLDAHKDWVEKYKLVRDRAEQQIFQHLTKDPVNKDRYVNGKLKTWKEKITTNFHGKSVPHEERCEATAILKIESVYNQGKNSYPQFYLEECRYIENSTQTCTLLSDSEDEGFAELQSKLL